MKLNSILALIFVVTLFIRCSSVVNLQTSHIALINNVSYNNAAYNNTNASNGFLVKYKKETYAITAKHILLIAKTDKMDFVDFEGELKEWKMHPKNDSTAYVTIDKLLNANRTDSLTWDYMFSNWESYDDWLVFSIKENKAKNSPLKFREKPLQKGDLLYAIGWAYSDTTGSQRIYKYEFEETEGNYHSLIQIEGPKSLGGLSGAPVVDENGQLVGLVTSGGEEEETKEVFLQVTTTKNMLDFISKLN